MTLYEKFIEEFTDEFRKNGIHVPEIHHIKENGFDTAFFGMSLIADGSPYNVFLGFFDEDDMLQVCIEKQIKVEDQLDVLKKINNYNSKCLGWTCFLNKGMVCAKSSCQANGGTEAALDLLMKAIIVAESFFPEFSES